MDERIMRKEISTLLILSLIFFFSNFVYFGKKSASFIRDILESDTGNEDNNARVSDGLFCS